MKNIFTVLTIFAVVLAGCDTNVGGDDTALARVTFINHSTFDVDIYYNFNPQFFDPTTFIGTVDTISRTLEVLVPASRDTLLGDIFYLHYKIPFANSFETGTTALFIQAERNMSNIPIVIESGGRYERTIENPPVNELRFINGIVRVQNLTNGHVWVENHGEILTQLGSGAAWLTPGQIGFFELTLPFLAESWPMEFLQSRDSNANRTPFPSFEMERGKLYSFEINHAGISDPVITNINLLGY